MYLDIPVHILRPGHATFMRHALSLPCNAGNITTQAQANSQQVPQMATALLDEVRQVVEYLQFVKDNGNLSNIEWADLLAKRQA